MKPTLSKAQKLAKTHTKAIESVMVALEKEQSSITIITKAGPVTLEPASVRAHRRRPLKTPTDATSETDKASWQESERLDEIDAMEGELLTLNRAMMEAVKADDVAKVTELQGRMKDLARRLQDHVRLVSEASTQ